ncbi:unnamed protein product [Rotaria sp. Silwood2]|nr:unnamed protein product [Rotaria sp. Silwood2]
MSISKIKHAAKSLKNFQGIRFEECLDNGETAEQLNKWLLEVSWEVANKVGGIYTVIRSKVPVTKKEYGNNYICVGPYNDSFVKTEVEVGESKIDAIRDSVNEMKRFGIHVVTGNWLIDGFPEVVLFDIGSAAHKLDGWKGDFFEYARIGIPYHDREANDALLFGFCVFWFIGLFIDQVKRRQKSYVIAHFHEWLAGVGLIMTRLRGYDCALIFTTHATLLGRYLCAGSTDFYNNLPWFDLDKEAGDRQIYHRYCVERAAATCAHVFTTVSKITGIESEYLLKRKPDVLTPNGLNVQKFAALHEFQNLHAQNKEKLNAFIRGHFYGHYDFDLDKTLYFFIAGRYEFSNKGADMYIEALARLNHMLKSSGSEVTVVAFLIFPTATNNFNVESLRGQSIAKMFRDTVSNIQVYFIQTSETSSNPSTPGISRSSTPAPPEHDDEATDDEDEHHPPPPPPQISFQKVPSKEPSSTDQAYKPSFTRPASATHLPLDKQFRAASVAVANAAAANEPTFPDALDDEIRQITIGKDHQSDLASTHQTTKHDDKVAFGLHDHGESNDSHDDQKKVPHEDHKTSIVVKNDFTIPNVLQETTITGNATSTESASAEKMLSSLNLEDQPITKSTRKEQSPQNAFGDGYQRNNENDRFPARNRSSSFNEYSRPEGRNQQQYQSFSRLSRNDSGSSSTRRVGNPSTTEPKRNTEDDLNLKQKRQSSEDTQTQEQSPWDRSTRH